MANDLILSEALRLRHDLRHRAGDHRAQGRATTPLVKELKRRKAYFVNDEEKAKLEQYMFGCTAFSGETPKLNSVVPGKSPQFIAHEAGSRNPRGRHDPRCRMLRGGRERAAHHGEAGAGARRA
ncbi:MAG: hypothetical protein ACLUUF_03790 [Bifidobacterium pullorum]